MFLPTLCIRHEEGFPRGTENMGGSSKFNEGGGGGGGEGGGLE